MLWVIAYVAGEGGQFVYSLIAIHGRRQPKSADGVYCQVALFRRYENRESRRSLLQQKIDWRG